ncbi:uncharacterized protein ELE39_003479 [Cryptosporidium sp. chipmunk genotype I]|uniref:uncharacterized protein n=1 Tax=Cryptosporidium sp. chipmunk genotype I TaxID=1280935 RepID=UPI00351A0D90|nr:hypothetical protein ELE39_003479 [Cryptosporidium sp. chipmunk genotype I]
MSQTIYKTDTNILTILKVEDNDKCSNHSDSTNILTNNSNTITAKIENSKEINQDLNFNEKEGCRKIHRKSTNTVTWDESAVDNEMMNKKRSKKCCIFHKRKNFGESSSSESESESESESDRESDRESDSYSGNYINKKR